MDKYNICADSITNQTEEAIPAEFHIIDKKDSEYVICMECKKKFKFITASHLKIKHQMTIEQYKEKYPNSPLRGTYTYRKFNSKKYRNDRLKIELVSSLKNKEEAINRMPTQAQIKEAAIKRIPTTTKINSILVDKDSVTSEKINQSQVFNSKAAATREGVKAKNYKPDIYTSDKKIVDIEEFMRTNIGLTGEHIFVNLYNIATYDFKTSGDKRPQYSPGDIIRSSELLLAYCYGRPVQRQVIDANVRQVTFTVGKPLPEDLNPEDF